MNLTRNVGVLRSAKSAIALMLMLAMLFADIPAVFVGQVQAQAASKTVSLAKKKATVAVGGKVTLKLKNATASKVKWTTSKKSVATVKSGVVTGKAKGTATIKATYKKKTYACKVTVVKAKLSKTSVSLRKGNAVTLKLTGGSGTTKWASSNKKVAAVTSKGKVTGKGAGSATITATNAGKKYTCKVTVLDVKKLGSKKLTAEKDSATIGNIDVGFMPGTIDKNSTLTVSEVNGAPEFDGVSMKTYDFKLSGSKLEDGDLAKLEIPLTLSSDQKAVAAYYNESTGTYEPVTSLYSDGKVTILTDHFSAFSVGATVKGADAAIAYENTTKAYIMYYYSIPDPKLDTSRSLSIMTETLNKKAPTNSCVKIGKDAVKDLIGWDFLTEKYGYGMDFGVNFLNSTGCTCSITRFINDNSQTFGYLGFAIAWLDALSDAIDGRGQMALYKGALANVSLMQGAMLTGLGWGTACTSALSFLIAVPTYMLTTVYKDSISNNEKKWFDVYNTYYNTEAKRHLYQWRNILQKYFDDKSLTAQQVSDAIQKEVDDYVEQLWNDRTLVAQYYSETTQKAFGLEGGLNPRLEKRISDEKRKELYNGDIKKVMEWFFAKQQKDATEAALKAADELAKGFDKTVKINFYDETSGGAASQLAGWTVKWKEIPSNITDPQNMETVLNSKGNGKVKFNTWAYFEYGFKPEVEIIAPDGTVVDELKIEWELENNKINVMTADVVDYLANHSLVINPTELEIDAGETVDVEVRNVALSAIKANSSNKSVATVTVPGSGNTIQVTGVKKGTATITVTSGNLTASCAVTVNEIENTTTKRTVYVGEEISIDAKDAIKNYDAIAGNYYSSARFTVGYESANENIANVNMGKIVGVKAGKTTVTLTLYDYGEKIATGTVHVTVKDKKVSISNTKLTVKTGKTKTLYLQERGTGKARSIGSGGVTWKSSNTKVATVSSNGKVTGVKSGSATVTATYKGKTYKCTVTVKKDSSSSSSGSNTSTTTPTKEQLVGSYDVKIGHSITIKAPSGMDASKIKWSSSNTDVVTVNSSGKVTGRAQGVAYVYADYGDTRYKFEIWSGDYED